MNRIEQLLERVDRQSITPAELFAELEARGPISAVEHARELKFIEVVAKAGALQAPFASALTRKLKHIQDANANQDATVLTGSTASIPEPAVSGDTDATQMRGVPPVGNSQSSVDDEDDRTQIRGAVPASSATAERVAASPVSDADVTRISGSALKDDGVQDATVMSVPDADADRTRLTGAKPEFIRTASQETAAAGRDADLSNSAQSDVSTPGHTSQTGTNTGHNTGTETGTSTGTGTGTGTGSQSASSSLRKISQSAESALATLKVGDIVRDRFVLEKEVGKGGMGIVYKALDKHQEEASDRNPYVALKVLNDEFRRHELSLRALQREAKRTQQLTHPNIIRVHDFDRDSRLNLVFMTMEYVDGKDLRSYIRNLGGTGITLNQARPLIEGMAGALGYAHSQGIVHSDFKPGNVMLTGEQIPKVFDFGIARASKQGGGSGEKTLFDAGELGALTPAYASLEMLRGQEPEAADDLYALGCVVYELLTGKHPFDKRSAEEALKQGMKPARPPKLTNRQWKTLQQSLAFERKDRIKVAAELVEGLRHRSLAERSAPFVIGGALLGVVGGGGTWWVQHELYVRDKKTTATGFHNATFSPPEKAFDALKRMNQTDRDSFLQTNKMDVIHYFDQQAKSLWNPQSKALNYTAARDLLNRVYNELYNRDSQQLAEVLQWLENDHATYYTTTSDRIKDLAAQTRWFSIRPDEDSVLSLLRDMKQAAVAPDRLKADADAQKTALLRAFDEQAEQTQPDIANLNRERDALLEVYGADDSQIASRTRDLENRIAQLEEQRKQLNAQIEIEEKRNAALTELHAAAERPAWDELALNQLIQKRDATRSAGVSQATIDAAMAPMSKQLVAQFANVDTGNKDSLSAALNVIKLARSADPTSAQLAELSTRLQNKLDSLISANEKLALATQAFDAVTARLRTDGTAMEDYRQRLVELQKVSGSVALSADLKEKALSGLAEAGKQAAGAQNYSLANTAIEEMRKLGADEAHLKIVQSAISTTQATAQQRDIDNARKTILDFAANPVLSNSTTKSVDDALKILSADNSTDTRKAYEALSDALQAQAIKRIDALQFDIAQQYIAQMRRLPSGTALADDLSRRIETAKAVAEQETQKAKRAALLNQIAAEVDAGEPKKARDRFEKVKDELATGGGDEAVQARAKIAEGYQRLAQKTLDNDGAASAQVSGALDMYKSALTYAQDDAARDTINKNTQRANKLLDIAKARESALALKEPASKELLARFDAAYQSAQQIQYSQLDKLKKIFDDARNRVAQTAPVNSSQQPTPPVAGPNNGATTPENGSAHPSTEPSNNSAPPVNSNTNGGQSAIPNSGQNTKLNPQTSPSTSAQNSTVSVAPVAEAPAGPDACADALAKQCVDHLKDGSTVVTLVIQRINASSPGYALGPHEVSNQEFNLFCNSAGAACSAGGDGTMPRVSVSPQLAEQYVKWLSAQTGRSYRLPSYAEWKKVASSADLPSANCATAEGLGTVTTPEITEVMANHGAARAGRILNILGNVAEIVNDGGSYIAAGGSINDVNCVADTRHPISGADRFVGLRILREIKP